MELNICRSTDCIPLFRKSVKQLYNWNGATR